MYICICAAVSDRQIKDAVRGGACSLDELAVCLGVGAGCGSCRAMAAEILVLETAAPFQAREVSRLAAPA